MLDALLEALRTCGTAARPPPTARPVTVRACSCRCRRARRLGLAMVFLRDEAARGRDRGRLPGRGHRAARVARGPRRHRCARRGRAASMPRIEQLALLGRATRCAPSARAAGRERTPRRVHRLALVPDGHLQGAVRGRPARALLPRPARPVARGAVRDLPPALLDEHRALVGAGPAVPAPLPQRRDQRDPGQRQLDARPGRATSARRTTSCSTRSSTRPAPTPAMLDNALELLVRARPRRPPRADDARSRGVGRATPSSTGSCATSTASTRCWSSRGTGRPGSSSPTAASSAPRSTATACGRCAMRSVRRPRRLLRPRRAPSTCRGAGRSAAAGSARGDARRRPRAGLRGRTARSRRGSPRGSRTGAGSDEGLRPRLERDAGRAAGGRPDRPPGGLRLHPRGGHRHPAPVAGRGHEPTSSMGDDTALPAARRPRPAALLATSASASRR